MSRGYTPFGEALWQGGEPFGFAGEQEDTALGALAGLVYLRARYYDPTIGRFISRDSYPATAAVPQSLHRYAYTGNDPVNRTDPSGETWYDAFANVPHEKARRPEPKVTRKPKVSRKASLQNKALTKDEQYALYLYENIERIEAEIAAQENDPQEQLRLKLNMFLGGTLRADLSRSSRSEDGEQQNSGNRGRALAGAIASSQEGASEEENQFKEYEPGSVVQLGDPETGEHSTYYVDSEGNGHELRNHPDYYTPEAAAEREQKKEEKAERIENEQKKWEAAQKAYPGQDLTQEMVDQYAETGSIFPPELLNQGIAEAHLLPPPSGTAPTETQPAMLGQVHIVDEKGREFPAGVYDRPDPESIHPARAIPLEDGTVVYAHVPEGFKFSWEVTPGEKIAMWWNKPLEEKAMDICDSVVDSIVSQIDAWQAFADDPRGTVANAFSAAADVVGSFSAKKSLEMSQDGRALLDAWESKDFEALFTNGTIAALHATGISDFGPTRVIAAGLATQVMETVGNYNASLDKKDFGGMLLATADVMSFGAVSDVRQGWQEHDWLRVASGVAQLVPGVGKLGKFFSGVNNILDLAMAGRSGMDALILGDMNQFGASLLMGGLQVAQMRGEVPTEGMLPRTGVDVSGGFYKTMAAGKYAANLAGEGIQKLGKVSDKAVKAGVQIIGDVSSKVFEIGRQGINRLDEFADSVTTRVSDVKKLTVQSIGRTWDLAKQGITKASEFAAELTSRAKKAAVVVTQSARYLASPEHFKYAGKLLQPQNHSLLRKLAENYAAR
ncbi:MAG: RHS repeat-associated core domain-containing protein [Chloroflexota bacterium]